LQHEQPITITKEKEGKAMRTWSSIGLNIIFNSANATRHSSATSYKQHSLFLLVSQWNICTFYGRLAHLYVATYAKVAAACFHHHGTSLGIANRLPDQQGNRVQTGLIGTHATSPVARAQLNGSCLATRKARSNLHTATRRSFHGI
jgi:hypothetical protein